MSIAGIDFKKLRSSTGMEPGIVHQYLEDVEADPQLGCEHFTLAVLQFLAVLHKDKDVELPPGIANAVAEFHPHFKTGDYRHSLGRFGLRKITSSWAKEMYPDATHELVVTLVEGCGDNVQTILVYL